MIDFTEAGKSDSGKKLFEQNPGGAPANLLTLASRMGGIARNLSVKSERICMGIF